MLKLILLGYVVISLVFEQSQAGFTWGRCPSTPNIPDFDVTKVWIITFILGNKKLRKFSKKLFGFIKNKYVGKWYNIENFPVGFQNGYSCSTAVYGLINPTTVTVYNRAIDL